VRNRSCTCSILSKTWRKFALFYAKSGLDHAWDGSPDVELLEQTIKSNMLSSGWRTDRVVVIVIDPELEAWLWQDSPHVATALRFTQHPSLRQGLEAQGLWDATAAKPSDPKRAVEVITPPQSGGLDGCEQP